MEPNFIKTIINTIQGRSIFLIGMMGSGKSKTGPELAKQLNYKFVDLDTLIENITKKSIDKIFDEDGENYFRELETKCLKEIIQIPSMIVSTGGGVITRKENWGVFRQGIVVWIDLRAEIALKRIKDQRKKRPLLNVKDYKKVYLDILNDRKYLYAQADIKVSINEESTEQVVDKILFQLNKTIN
tara:strand:+ start:103 stop:657 length:555 start_codon:yes stop_codon:yes gene_type:complete